MRRWIYNLWYMIKYLPFRITRGFWPYESWNLSYYTAKYILPRIKHMRDNGMSYGDDYSPEEWDNVLGEIEWMLGVFCNAEGDGKLDLDAVLSSRYKYAENLLRKHLFDLWD